MRLLKKKIALAKELQLKNEQRMAFLKENCNIVSPLPSPRHNQLKEAQKKKTLIINTITEPSRAIKNVVKNFGRAICNFASSKLAIPYLEKFILKEGIQLDDFIQYVRKMKSKILGLSHFRSLLLQEKNENPTITTFKRLFRAISEIFIKYFSVNWIFDSKVQYKQAHLRSRFKILRRIQNPELFTYFQIDHGKQELEVNQNN